eukprot:gene7627-9383_t
MESTLICSYCKLEFNLDDRIPQTLKGCDDSVCLKCIKQHNNSNDNTNTLCPICKEHSKSYKDNKVLIKFLKAANNSGVSFTGSSNSSFINNNSNSSDKKERICEKHSQYYFSYCSVCEMIPICQECLVTEHNGHQVKVAADQVEFMIHLHSYQEKINQIKDHQLKQVDQLVQQQEHIIKSTNQHYDGQLEYITAQFEQLHTELQNRELDLLKYVSKQKEEEMNKQVSNLSVLEQTKSDIESILQFYDNNIQQLLDDQQNNSDPEIIKKNENTIYGQYKNSVLLSSFRINQFLDTHHLKLSTDKQPTVYCKSKNQILQLVKDFGEILDIEYPSIYLVGGDIVKSMTKHCLFKIDSNQKISFDKEYDLRCIETATVFVKGNKQNQTTDTIYIFGANNQDKTIKKCRLNRGSDNCIIESIKLDITMGSNPTSIFDGERYIYIFGGWIKENETEKLDRSMKRVLRFDITNDKLEALNSNLQQGRYQSKGCYDGKRYIYLFSGWDKNDTLIKNIERFDTVKMKSEIFFHFNMDKFNFFFSTLIIHEDYLYFTIDKQFYKLNLLTQLASSWKTDSMINFLIFDPRTQNQFIAIDFSSKDKLVIYSQSFTSVTTDNLKLFKYEYTIPITQTEFDQSCLISY